MHSVHQLPSTSASLVIGFRRGDQKSVRRDAQRAVMVASSPCSSFIVCEPDLVLELLLVTVAEPSHLGEAN
jgi:hypothetical protein